MGGGGQDGEPRVGEESGRERCKGPYSHFSTGSLMAEAGLGAWGSPREKGMGREGEERSGGALWRQPFWRGSRGGKTEGRCVWNGWD